MSEDNYWTGAFVRALKRIGRLAGVVVTVAILPAILIYVFCFSMKTTSEYRCALQVMKEDARVLASTGAPIQPGWIAWTKYYESGGMLTQGMFVTYVSGPDGGGTLEVNFYRAPVGATLGIWFSKGGEEIEVYDGRYPCDE